MAEKGTVQSLIVHLISWNSCAGHAMVCPFTS